MMHDTTHRTRRRLLTMMGKATAGLALYRGLDQAMPALAYGAEAPGKTLRVEAALTEQNVAPYGSMLGKPFPTQEGVVAFRTDQVASWRQTLFNAGKGGEVEIVWVNYKITDPLISRLEQHSLTEQSVVPLTGDIIQILALSGADGAPDASTLRAFRLTPGIGINMARGVWHTTRSKGATCLMLTRGSTSVDILDHRKGKPLTETSVMNVAPIRLLN